MTNEEEKRSSAIIIVFFLAYLFVKERTRSSSQPQIIRPGRLGHRPLTIDKGREGHGHDDVEILESDRCSCRGFTLCLPVEDLMTSK